VHGRELIRHTRERFCGRNHVFRVTTIERNSGGEQGYLACKELAASAMVAIAAIPAVPTNTDALAILPWFRLFADKLDNPNHLVSWHTRIFNTKPKSFLNQVITVTHAACINLDTHPSRLRFGNISFNRFYRSAT